MRGYDGSSVGIQSGANKELGAGDRRPSKLELMRDDYHRKLLKEKEEKMVQLYEDSKVSQRQAMMRVMARNGSGGKINGGHTPNNGASVRDFFNERRRMEASGVPVPPIDNHYRQTKGYNSPGGWSNRTGSGNSAKKISAGRDRSNPLAPIRRPGDTYDQMKTTQTKMTNGHNQKPITPRNEVKSNNPFKARPQLVKHKPLPAASNRGSGGNVDTNNNDDRDDLPPKYGYPSKMQQQRQQQQETQRYKHPAAPRPHPPSKPKQEKMSDFQKWQLEQNKAREDRLKRLNNGNTGGRSQQSNYNNVEDSEDDEVDDDDDGENGDDGDQEDEIKRLERELIEKINREQAQLQRMQREREQEEREEEAEREARQKREAADRAKQKKLDDARRKEEERRQREEEEEFKRERVREEKQRKEEEKQRKEMEKRRKEEEKQALKRQQEEEKQALKRQQEEEKRLAKLQKQNKSSRRDNNFSAQSSNYDETPLPSSRRSPPLPTSSRLPTNEDLDERPVVAVSDSSYYAKMAKSRDAHESVGSLAKCRQCGRSFAPDRLKKHQDACKIVGKQRKVFDATKHRLEGTGAEKYIGKAKKPEPKKKNNWRHKHEEFIQSLRYAKKVAQVEKEGGDLRQLTPPPPSENPDLVPCPYCNRTFNQTAAERHIPRCKDLKTRPAPMNTRRR